MNKKHIPGANTNNIRRHIFFLRAAIEFITDERLDEWIMAHEIAIRIHDGALRRAGSFRAILMHRIILTSIYVIRSRIFCVSH